MLHIIGDLIWKCDHSQLTYPNLVTCMDRLIADTQHVTLCKKIKAYDMRRADLIFFLIGVVCLVSKGEDLCTSVRMA